MIDSWIISSPTCIRPRACSTAMRALVPVPVGLRSERPGATMQVLRVTLPTPAKGRLSCTIETPAIAGFSGWATVSCWRAAEADLLADHGEVAGLVRHHRKTEPGGIDDGVEHAAIGDVERDGAEALDLDDGVQPVDEGRDIGDLDRAAAAVAAAGAGGDRSGRRVEAHHRFRLLHGDDAGLEQHRDGADGVRAGHRRIFGGLHDDDAGIAIVAGRRHEQVDVAGDTAARLADQEAADVVEVAFHAAHLVEHGASGRGQDAADDDVADLAFGMASHERYQALASHLSRTFAVSVMAISAARTMRSSSIDESSAPWAGTGRPAASPRKRCATSSGVCGTWRKPQSGGRGAFGSQRQEPVKAGIAQIAAGAQRQAGRNAGHVAGILDGAKREGGEQRSRAILDDRPVAVGMTVIVGKSEIGEVDGQPLDADHRLARRQAETHHGGRVGLVEQRRDRRPDPGQGHRQGAADDGTTGDGGAVQLLHRLVRRVGGEAAKGLETGDENRPAAGRCRDGLGFSRSCFSSCRPLASTKRLADPALRRHGYCRRCRKVTVGPR